MGWKKECCEEEFNGRMSKVEDRKTKAAQNFCKPPRRGLRGTPCGWPSSSRTCAIPRSSATSHSSVVCVRECECQYMLYV